MQWDFVTDENGIRLVDFIGKFENLHVDFAKVCGLIGVVASVGHQDASL